MTEQYEYLVAAVHSALAQDPRVGELELDIAIDESTIRIAGLVSTEERKAAVAEVVSEIAEGRTVINETEVKVLGAPGKAEEI